MKDKINIAELLKDCPKGMELYSPIFGEVYLDKIRPHLAIVVTTDKEQGNFKEEFLYDGRYGMNGECMLFPSKDKTTWEGFQRPFKDGDILSYQFSGFENRSIYIYMYHRRMNTTYYVAVSGGPDSEFMINNKEGHALNSYNDTVRFATEEEKQKLFDALKANGYKWDEETKTLEKLIEPKFKVGDRIKSVISSSYYTVIDVKNDQYFIKSDTEKYPYQVSFSYEIYYELVTNKFDITTLKPFDSKVLVRHNKNNKWCGSFFSHIDEDFHSHCYKFVTTAGKSYPYCIPYEANKHLLGTTDGCDEFFIKLWE